MKKLFSLLAGTLLLLGAGCAPTSTIETNDSEGQTGEIQIDGEVRVDDSSDDSDDSDDSEEESQKITDDGENDSADDTSAGASNSDYAELEALGGEIDSNLDGMESGELEF